MTFTAIGEYLVSGGEKGVQVWQVKDGERVAVMQTKGIVFCIAVSKDGRFIAAGSGQGDVFVWDGTTYFEKVFAAKIPGAPTIRDVDFSPDSTRLVSADGTNNTATIWDIAAQQKAQTLDHWAVPAAKYSSQGNRIATAGYHSVRVWDSNDGQLLVDVEVGLMPLRGLLWLNNHCLFVKTNNSKIKQIDASTRTTVAEWSVPPDSSCIAMPQHGQFIAYSTRGNITFWDTSTHTQLAIIPRSSESRLIAFSPDNRLAIGLQGQKILIQNIFLNSVRPQHKQFSISHLHLMQPDIRIDNAALYAWKNGRLTKAEGLLTSAISTSRDTAHVLASRALVRAYMRQWDAALVDAEEVHSLYSHIYRC